MILTLWIIFLILSFTLIFFGRRFDTTISDVLIPTGWVFIFVLGTLLLFHHVEYTIGETHITTNTYETNPFNESLIINSTTTTTQNYTTIENPDTTILGKLDGSHIFGLLLAILGGFGFATFWYDIKKQNRGY